VPPLFTFLKVRGGVEWTEMHRVFNMGIGMIFIVPPGAGEVISRDTCRWKPFPIGRVVVGEKKVHVINLPKR
jgi:phosphoribosylformylglycinamidine cyclo-ligase